MRNGIGFFLTVLGLLTSCQSDNDNVELATGWNTWDTNSVLSHVLFPEGLALNLKLLDGRFRRNSRDRADRSAVHSTVWSMLSPAHMRMTARTPS